MMRFIPSLALLALCLIPQQPAEAQSVQYVAGWRLEQGSTGPFRGCALSKKLATGLTVGFIRPPEANAPIRVILMQPGWASLVHAQIYPLDLQIGMKKYAVQAQAADVAGGKMLTFNLTWDQYYRGFFNTLNGFFVEYNGSQLLGYSPSTYEKEAVVRQSQCIKSYDDPFSR